MHDATANFLAPHSHEPLEKAEVNDRNGIALIAALILIAIVGIVGAAVLQSTSTEVAMSGYYKRAVEGLYAAEAGIAEAQARLWLHPGAEAYFIMDPQPGYSAQWSAYLVATQNWAVQNDPTFSVLETNYIPIPGYPDNAVAQFNSVQSPLSYWVKVQHKTEKDAEQAGHQTSRPHYVDEDGSLSRHRGTSKGNILYFGYPSTVTNRLGQFTTSGLTPYLPVERVTVYSMGKGQTTRIQVEAVHDPGPPQFAALVSQTTVTLSGEQGVINGQDACGASPSRPPIAAQEIVPSSPRFQLGGSPPSPKVGTLNLGLQDRVSEWQRGAIVVSDDQRNKQWGSPSLPLTVVAHSEALPHQDGLMMEYVNGHGILAVDGHVRIQGPVSWSGLMVVTGTLIFDAPGSTIAISGGVWAGEVDVRTGLVNIQYDSCRIKAALLTRPVKLINWKELY